MQYQEFPFEIKMVSEEEDGYISGYASVFGGPPDLQGDIMVRGCFKDTIMNTPGWPMLFGHSMLKCCGFWTKAEEDHRGLLIEGQLTLDSPEGASAAAIVRHGAKLKLPFGLSIGYSINPEGYKMDGDTRKLTSVALHEVSLVPVPACRRARVARVKAATLREAERYLIQTGMTGDEARAFISLCKAERDAKPNGNDDPERDAKDLERGGAFFMATMRQAEIALKMKGLI